MAHMTGENPNGEETPLAEFLPPTDPATPALPWSAESIPVKPPAATPPWVEEPAQEDSDHWVDDSIEHRHAEMPPPPPLGNLAERSTVLASSESMGPTPGGLATHSSTPSMTDMPEPRGIPVDAEDMVTSDSELPSVDVDYLDFPPPDPSTMVTVLPPAGGLPLTQAPALQQDPALLQDLALLQEPLTPLTSPPHDLPVSLEPERQDSFITQGTPHDTLVAPDQDAATDSSLGFDRQPPPEDLLRHESEEFLQAETGVDPLLENETSESDFHFESFTYPTLETLADRELEEPTHHEPEPRSALVQDTPLDPELSNLEATSEQLSDTGTDQHGAGPAHSIRPQHGRRPVPLVLGVVAGVALLTVLAIVLMALLGETLAKPGPEASPGSGQTAAPAPGSPDLSAPIPVGQQASFPCFYGEVSFTVSQDATVTTQLGNNEPQESYVYVVVPMLIEFFGDEDYVHAPNRSVLVAPDGTQYFTDVPGMVAAKNSDGATNPFIVLDLPSGGSAEGSFVYQVPKDQTHGLQFQLSLADAPVVTMKIGL
ncbi:MAG: hypothetical protein FWG15_02270 [Propionibacteriaceae bacterium]|nr:hypothetical protein [Propionibacteriaceae bacterium]